LVVKLIHVESISVKKPGSGSRLPVSTMTADEISYTHSAAGDWHACDNCGASLLTVMGTS